MRTRRIDRPGCHDGFVARTLRTQFAHADLELVADLRLGATFQPAEQHVRQRGVGDSARLRHAGDLACILVSPGGFDHATDRHKRRLEQPLKSLELLVGHVRRLETQRCIRRHLVSERIEHRCTGQADDHAPIDACLSQLCRGLVAVSTVGDKDDVLRGQQHPSVGAGEACEPADVGEVADQQRLGLIEPLAHALTPPGNFQRRHHCELNFAATASTASLYPCMPKPMIDPVDTGAMTLV